MAELEYFGFDGKQPVPCSQRAAAIAVAVAMVARASERLQQAIENVPGYTAQWSPEDYYANEQEAYYRAAEALEAAIDGSKA